MVNRDEFLAVGKVSKPHGIHGEMKVYFYSEQPQEYTGLKTLYLGAESDGPLSRLTIERARVQGKQVIIQARECRSRSQAEELAGLEVWRRKADLPEPDADEFYLYELIGKKIIGIDGKTIGIAVRFLKNSGQDILVVRGGGVEHLIPLHGNLIEDIGEDEVIMDLPSGLLDLNR